ncbi:phospho-N-acetylmuramoyl-pentapeptide-transferase homolog isoform X2 [Carex rostrata]
MQFSYKVKPTMGGLFFIPIGVIVSVVLIGKSSDPVNGSIIATLAFGAVGLFDDVLRGSGRRVGFSGWLKLTIQEIFDSSAFSIWASVPRRLGSFYFIATILCFLAMSNRVTVTNDIDGLALGIAALAFLIGNVWGCPCCLLLIWQVLVTP